MKMQSASTLAFRLTFERQATPLFKANDGQRSDARFEKICREFGVTLESVRDDYDEHMSYLGKYAGTDDELINLLMEALSLRNRASENGEATLKLAFISRED